MVKIKILLLLFLIICLSIPATATEYAYIGSLTTNNGSIQVVDLDTQEITDLVTIPSTSYGSKLICTNPVTNRVYAGTVAGTYVKIFEIDTLTNTVYNSFTAASTPSSIMVNPDGSKLYVCGASNYYYIDVYWTGNLSLKKHLGIGDNGNYKGMAFSPDGSKLYMATYDNLVVIDAESDTLTSRVSNSGTLFDVVFSQNRDRAYAIDLSNKIYRVINTTTNSFITSIPIPNSPYECVITDIEKLYIGNANGVSVYDAYDNSLLSTITLPGSAIPCNGMSLNADESKLYVPLANTNNMAVISTSSDTVIDTFACSNGNYGISLFHDFISSGSVTANFNANVTYGDAPLSVQFTDTSSGTPTSWEWDFGDNSTSYEQNPIHTYSAGTYTVSLTVSDAEGEDTETKTNYIYAGGGSGSSVVIASFSMNDSSGTSPLTVQFTDNSYGAESLLWNFDDGNTSNETNPIHTFYNVSTYTISLTAYNGGEHSTQYQNVYVTETEEEGSSWLDLSDLWDWLEAIYNAVVGGFSGITGSITNSTSSIGDWISGSTDSILGGLTNSTDRILSPVNGIYDFLTNTSDFSTAEAENSSLFLPVKNASESINSSVCGFFDRFASPVTNMSESMNGSASYLDSDSTEAAESAAIMENLTSGTVSAMPSSIIWLGNIFIWLAVVGFVIRPKN